jgi:hypothetical protein
MRPGAAVTFDDVDRDFPTLAAQREHVPIEQHPLGLREDGHGPMADVNPLATMDLTSGLQQPLSVVHVDHPLPRVLKDRLRTDRHPVVVVVVVVVRCCNDLQLSVCVRVRVKVC